VLDTSVLYAALRSRRGAARRVVDLTLDGKVTAHVSVPLVLEYEAVLLREAEALGITPREARIVLAALVQQADRHAIHYRWPSYVRDPDDAHVLATAVAASCPHLITFNKRDFHRAWEVGVTLHTPRISDPRVFLTKGGIMGALTIRLPESLHAHVRRLAEQEGFSMNQFVMLAVAEKMTRLDEGAPLAYLEVLEHIGAVMAEDEGQSLQEAARAVLDRAPDAEPPPEDRLPGEMSVPTSQGDTPSS